MELYTIFKICEIDTVTISLLVGLLVFLILYVIFNGRNRPKNFPPGPFPLPVIGNIHTLGLEPYKKFMRMRKDYGDVFSVYFGSYPAVILNGHQVIRKYFNMSHILGRPNLIPFVERNPENIARGVIATQGKEWLEQRRFVLRNLRDFGFGKNSIEVLINDGVTELITTLAKSLGTPVATQDVFRRAVVESLYLMCFGERCKESDEEFESFLNSIAKTIRTTPAAGMLFFFPKISKVFPKISGFNDLLDWSYPMINTFKSQFQQHKTTFNENSKRDLIDCYVSEFKKITDPKSSFYGPTGERNMELTIQDLFIGGSETTSTTLSWTFLILALYPSIQNKLQDEIDNVIGNYKPCLAHKADMPYYQAMLMEILRYSSILPMSLFHTMTETGEIEGYTVSEGTIVIANVYGVHRDPELWGQDVNEINPERFLSDDGKTVLKNHEGYMPFSTGKRTCPGEGFAKDTLFLFITSIFQKYRVTPDPNAPKPTLDYNVGTTLSPLDHKIVLNDRNRKS